MRPEPVEGYGCLDLLIDREHDEIADVDVTGQCQHVQDGIGHVLRGQPSSGRDAIGDRRSISDLPQIVQYDTWRDTANSYPRSDQLPTKTMSQCLYRVLG